MVTTIQLDDEVRENLREHQLPGESASDAVARLLADSEPPQFGVDAAEAERIAEQVVERKMREARR